MVFVAVFKPVKGKFYSVFLQINQANLSENEAQEMIDQ